MAKFETVDAYVATFPPETRARLEEVRKRIRSAAPDLEEGISYDIPGFTLHGRSVVYFAGWRHHISIYPVPAAEGRLAADLAPYVSGKGTLGFSLDREIPFDLIEQVVRLLIAQRVETAV
jgi:uncharacterized protein YdhG (YjbR/CyaY superfamily)